MEKKFINFEKGTLFIPKGISKTKYRDEELGQSLQSLKYCCEIF